MIDITDDMVAKARQVQAFEGRVYRAFPQTVDGMRPFAVVNPAGRMVTQTDNEGGEVVVSATYLVSIYGNSPEEVDDRFRELTNIYNHGHIQNAGYSPTYQMMNGMFAAQATYTAIVDKRGFVYSR